MNSAMQTMVELIYAEMEKLGPSNPQRFTLLQLQGKAAQLRDTEEKSQAIRDYSQGRFDQFHAGSSSTVTEGAIAQHAADYYQEFYTEADEN